MSLEFGSPALAPGDFCTRTCKTELKREGLREDTAMPKLVQTFIEYSKKWDFTRTSGLSWLHLFIWEAMIMGTSFDIFGG